MKSINLINYFENTVKMNSAISGDEMIIPLSAVAVKVTNIINPYFIRIYELENHAMRANVISRKLQLYAQKNLDFNKESKDLLNLGDTLIVFNEVYEEIPAWWCRGILGRINDAHTKYNVFLPDYGIALELAQSNFRKISKDIIPDEYLTTTIGLNNVVPAAVVKANKSKERTIVSIVEEWTESAICCTRELVSASEKIWFDPQACDENQKRYGELYLIIDEEVVVLSKALTLSLFAVNLNDDLLSLINNSELMENSRVKKMNDGLLILNEDLEKSFKSETQVSNFDNSRNTSRETETAEERENYQDLNKKKRYRNSHKKDDQQILIRSEYKCKFIENVTEARFPQNIHKVLQDQGVSQPKKIQSYMWPAVKMGLDVIAIAPPDSGKTYGYLVPIVSYLTAQEKLPKGTVPTTLILCSSSSNVTNTAYLCGEFLSDYPHIKVVAALNGKPEKSLLVQIYNGCQVLVSTVPFLARFLRKFKSHKVIDLNRLRHIILDGADVILDKYMEPAMEIFIKHKVMREKQDRYDNDLTLQVITVARQWTIGLRQFMDKSIFYPYVCIGSYMEAAAFSRVQAKLFLVKSEQKKEQILEALNQHDIITEKIMILCTDAEEAINLNKFLQLHKKKTLLAHSNMIFDEVHGIKEDWASSVSGMYPILICTDDVLPDLDIKDVNWLIHHSVNLTSKSRFYYRFSTLMDNFHSDKNRCKVLILVDDSNNVQFQGLVEIMQRLHASMPAFWLKAVNDIAITLDRKKKDYPICDNVKSLGFCPKRTNCSYRHCILNGVDVPVTDVSVGDTVELMVTYIHNATHFSARLVKCFKMDQKDPINYPFDHSVRLSSQMQKYYSNVENRRGRKKLEVGDICGMEDIIDHYKRVQIIHIISKNHFNEPSLVSVRCIDDGSVMLKVRASKLLDIPESLLKVQTNIIEVFISDLEPYDKEYEWDLCANEAVESWFKEFFDSKSSVIAKVNLHLGNTIWVDTLEMRTKVKGFPEFSVSSLRSCLIENNHGKESKGHLIQLYELCKAGGITNFDFNEISVNENEQVD